MTDEAFYTSRNIIVQPSPTTLAALAKLTNVTIDTEHGQAEPVARRAVFNAVTDSVVIDSRERFYALNAGAEFPDDVALVSYARTVVRTLLEDELAKRLCECAKIHAFKCPHPMAVNGTLFCHNHWQADVPEINGARLCGACHVPEWQARASKFTVQIEAFGGGAWQALDMSERSYAMSAGEAARFVVANQTIAGEWRVVVWDGFDADTSSTPALIYAFDHDPITGEPTWFETVPADEPPAPEGGPKSLRDLPIFGWAYGGDASDAEGHLPLNPHTDRYETGGDEITFADEGDNI